MKRTLLPFLLVGISSLFLFYIFSREVRGGFLKKFDFDTTVRIQSKLIHEGRIDTDTLMEGATFFVSPETSLVWLAIMTLSLLVDIRRKRIRFGALVIPVLFGLMIAGELYGKTVVHHPSPPFFMIRNPTTIFPKYYVNEAYSYPSGHAARSLFLSLLSVCALWPILHGPVKKGLSIIFAVGFVGLVGVSRIYLGHHWLSDILGGLFLGAGFSLPIVGLYLGEDILKGSKRFMRFV